MARNTDAVPSGAFEELMRLAIEQGSVTAQEIAEILWTDQLPVNYESDWYVGN